MTPTQLAWIRTEYLRLHAQYYGEPHPTDYDRGSAWGDLAGYARLLEAFGIPVDPDRISPAEAGWAREAVRQGLA